MCQTFLHVDKKDLYCLYSSMAISILVLQFWCNEVAGDAMAAKLARRNMGEETSSSSSSGTLSSSSSEHLTSDESGEGKIKAKAKQAKLPGQQKKKKFKKLPVANKEFVDLGFVKVKV